MKYKQKHIIQKQFFALDFPRSEGAFELQNKLKRLYQSEVLPQVDTLISNLVSPDQFVRIPSLNIDLGDIPLDQLEQVFVDKCLENITDQLNFSYQLIHQNPESELSIVSKEQSILEIFIYFLKTGSLPWQTREEWRNNFQIVVSNALEKDGTSITPNINQLFQDNKQSIKRLIWQFSPEILESVVGLLVGIPLRKDAINLIQYFRKIIESTNNFPFALKYMEESLKESTLTEATLVNKGGKQNASLIKEIIKNWALKLATENWGIVALAMIFEKVQHTDTNPGLISLSKADLEEIIKEVLSQQNISFTTNAKGLSDIRINRYLSALEAKSFDWKTKQESIIEEIPDFRYIDENFIEESLVSGAPKPTTEKEPTNEGALSAKDLENPIVESSSGQVPLNSTDEKIWDHNDLKTLENQPIVKKEGNPPAEQKAILGESEKEFRTEKEVGEVKSSKNEPEKTSLEQENIFSSKSTETTVDSETEQRIIDQTSNPKIPKTEVKNIEDPTATLETKNATKSSLSAPHKNDKENGEKETQELVRKDILEDKEIGNQETSHDKSVNNEDNFQDKLVSDSNFSNQIDTKDQNAAIFEKESIETPQQSRSKTLGDDTSDLLTQNQKEQIEPLIDKSMPKFEDEIEFIQSKGIKLAQFEADEEKKEVTLKNNLEVLPQNEDAEGIDSFEKLPIQEEIDEEKKQLFNEKINKSGDSIPQSPLLKEDVASDKTETSLEGNNKENWVENSGKQDQINTPTLTKQFDLTEDFDHQTFHGQISDASDLVNPKKDQETDKDQMTQSSQNDETTIDTNQEEEGRGSKDLLKEIVKLKELATILDKKLSKQKNSKPIESNPTKNIETEELSNPGEINDYKNLGEEYLTQKTTSEINLEPPSEGVSQDSSTPLIENETQSVNLENSEIGNDNLNTLNEDSMEIHQIEAIDQITTSELTSSEDDSHPMYLSASGSKHSSEIQEEESGEDTQSDYVDQQSEHQSDNKSNEFEVHPKRVVSESVKANYEAYKNRQIPTEGNTPKIAYNLVNKVTGEYYLENAGLILLAPFFTNFFNKLEYLEKGQFKNEQLHNKAIAITQYLVNYQDQFEEFELVLNKVLCGYTVDMAIQKEIEISPSEKEEARKLLESAIEHWGALKSTSPEGLQYAFLSRKGKLSYSEDDQAWTLQVENKPIDILLDKLPFGWTYSAVKLPWMDNLVKVDWA